MYIKHETSDWLWFGPFKYGQEHYVPPCWNIVPLAHTHTGVVLTAWTLALAVVFCVRWRPASFLLTSRLFWSQSLSRNCWWSISVVTSALYTANCSWESIVFSIQQHNGWTFMVKSLWIMEWDVQWVTSTWRKRICFKEDAVVVTFSTTWFIQVGLECCSWNNILCCSGNNISVHLNLLLKLNGCCKGILKTAVLLQFFVIPQNQFCLNEVFCLTLWPFWDSDSFQVWLHTFY